MFISFSNTESTSLTPKNIPSNTKCFSKGSSLNDHIKITITSTLRLNITITNTITSLSITYIIKYLYIQYCIIIHKIFYELTYIHFPIGFDISNYYICSNCTKRSDETDKSI